MKPCQGLLNPMLLIAAIAAVAFSVSGIASISGVMPSAMLSSSVRANDIAENSEAPLDTPHAGAAFQCAECGILQSIREIDWRGGLFDASLATANRRIEAAQTPEL